jgi:hypothetical protein
MPSEQELAEIQLHVFLIPIYFENDKVHYSPEVVVCDDEGEKGFLELTSDDLCVFKTFSEIPIIRKRKKLFSNSEDAFTAGGQMAVGYLGQKTIHPSIKLTKISNQN